MKQANTFLGCMFICVSNMTHGFYNDILNCACMHIIISMCVCTLLNPVAESQVRSTTDDVDALDYVEISILGNGAARLQLVYLVPLSALLGEAV